MGILSSLGLGSGRKVRYAVVGVGDIAQEAMLPGIAHTGNSELVALVTGDPAKARKVGEQYGVERTWSYEGFEEMLRSGEVDAIYLATPNWQHAGFAIPALRAGIHVLVEKPLEVTTVRCREIIDAQEASGAKLMVAYRLHFEPATLAAIETVRSGELGDILVFTSTFGQVVDTGNHRALNGELAGPLFDMGPYPVNAARFIFGAEPTEVVSAVGTRHPGSGFDGTFYDTVAVTLRFPGERLAQFVVSYVVNVVNSYVVVGTKGSLEVNPAYMYGMPLEHAKTVGETRSHRAFKSTDHFGGEMKYFSDCILNGRDVEPDGWEGYADVRVLEGILEALKTGRPRKLEPFERTKRIDTDAQLQELSPRKSPDLVNASNPGRGKDKVPAN